MGEVLGFDVLLDTDLRPWLVEVNHSPSWAVSSPEDEAVKHSVIESTLRALAVERHTLSGLSRPAPKASVRAKRRLTGTSAQSGAKASNPLEGSGKVYSLRKQRMALTLD